MVDIVHGGHHAFRSCNGTPRFMKNMEKMGGDNITLEQENKNHKKGSKKIMRVWSQDAWEDAQRDKDIRWRHKIHTESQNIVEKPSKMTISGYLHLQALMENSAARDSSTLSSCVLKSEVQGWTTLLVEYWQPNEGLEAPTMEITTKGCKRKKMLIPCRTCNDRRRRHIYSSPCIKDKGNWSNHLSNHRQEMDDP